MQRLNHHHLYVFWVFSKHLSFTRAAQELLIAQSAVTSQVKSLEDALDLKLVDRSNPRRPQITAEGRKVIEYAESIFESSRELLHWATKGSLPKKRTMRIGAISGLSRNFQFEFIEPLIGNLGEKSESRNHATAIEPHDDANDLKFEITTGDQDNLIQMLSEHRLDVVLSSRNADPDSKTQLHSHVLTQSPLVFLINKKSVSRAPKDFVAFMRGRSVFIPGRHFEAKPELDAYLEKLKQLRVAGEVDDVALLRILALRSGQVVVMPEMGIRSDIQSGEVVVLNQIPGVRQRFYAITRQRREPNSDVRYLISKMRAL